MTQEVKPPSPQELLASLSHHGVKGMHWGVRKSVTKSSTDVPLNKRKFTTEEIKTARANQAKRAETHQKNIDDSKRNPDDPKHLLWNDKLDKSEKDWQSSDDRYIANRKTKGEKFVATLLSGPVGLYRTSDLMTNTRAANENPFKYKRVKSYPFAEKKS